MSVCWCNSWLCLTKWWASSHKKLFLSINLVTDPLFAFMSVKNLSEYLHIFKSKTCNQFTDNSTTVIPRFLVVFYELFFKSGYFSSFGFHKAIKLLRLKRSPLFRQQWTYPLATQNSFQNPCLLFYSTNLINLIYNRVLKLLYFN